MNGVPQVEKLWNLSQASHMLGFSVQNGRQRILNNARKLGIVFKSIDNKSTKGLNRDDLDRLAVSFCKTIAWPDRLHPTPFHCDLRYGQCVILVAPNASE